MKSKKIIIICSVTGCLLIATFITLFVLNSFNSSANNKSPEVSAAPTSTIESYNVASETTKGSTEIPSVTDVEASASVSPSSDVTISPSASTNDVTNVASPSPKPQTNNSNLRQQKANVPKSNPFPLLATLSPNEQKGGTLNNSSGNNIPKTTHSPISAFSNIMYYNNNSVAIAAVNQSNCQTKEVTLKQYFDTSNFNYTKVNAGKGKEFLIMTKYNNIFLSIRTLNRTSNGKFIPGNYLVKNKTILIDITTNNFTTTPILLITITQGKESVNFPLSYTSDGTLKFGNATIVQDATIYK